MINLYCFSGAVLYNEAIKNALFFNKCALFSHMSSFASVMFYSIIGGIGKILRFSFRFYFMSYKLLLTYDTALCC